MKYTPVIGMEVHIELRTKSKMFCGCSADHFGVDPNTHTCPVCLGLPGAMPVPNKEAILRCIKIGLALNSTVNKSCTFDRKHYFYPDLPKGFQISQYDDPFCKDGELPLKDGRKVRVTRVHMEEDTGKLVHSSVDGDEVSLVDFNRSGVPLVEIVTEPDLKSVEDAVFYVKERQRVVRALGVSDCDMEKGSMRLEANISMSDSDELPEYKVEVKNLNSFKFMKRSLEYEMERQVEILERGEVPAQETRGYDPDKGETFVQREKEEAHDYRYFPEPDIPPIDLSSETDLGKEVSKLGNDLPELPWERRVRLNKELVLTGVSAGTAQVLISDEEREREYQKLTKEFPNLDKKDVVDFLVNINIDAYYKMPIKDIPGILERKGFINDQEFLSEFVDMVIQEHSSVVQEYISGKEEVLGFLMGQVMKKSGGKADGEISRTLLVERLRDMR